MAFPSLTPTARSFTPGDYPVKTFKSQNGSETRILYGSTRTNMKLSLTFSNIDDDDADLILSHYDEVQGTFQRFKLGGNDFTLGGWEGSILSQQPVFDNKYRYEGPPQVTQVRPGISTVTVNLIGVL